MVFWVTITMKRGILMYVFLSKLQVLHKQVKNIHITKHDMHLYHKNHYNNYTATVITEIKEISQVFFYHIPGYNGLWDVILPPFFVPRQWGRKIWNSISNKLHIILKFQLTSDLACFFYKWWFWIETIFFRWR